MTDPKMTELDDLLANAAAKQVTPDADLMTRVLADAQRLQPATPVPFVARPSLWAAFVQMIGGWPAMGGLATAGIAGLWIGVAPPLPLENLAAEWLGTSQTVDLLGTALDVQEAFDG